VKVLRGSVALFFVFLLLLLGDPVQRFLVIPLARVWKSRRMAIMARWQHVMRWIALSPIIYIGGARFPRPLGLPGDGDVLILMNHQSVFDIPVVVESLPVTAYPRFVTRKRYFKWIPLVSHLVRSYGFPSVDPRADSSEMKRSLAAIKETARKTDAPLCIFPEGTRTRDGEIGPFKTTGLKLILKQRPWRVYALVGDGYWKTARIKDFVGGMSDVRGRLELAGVFEWTDPKGDPAAFIEQVREAMVARLAEIRSETRA
jgi:1-acyl-sn-glycerol-3-phosphate acyltransferase